MSGLVSRMSRQTQEDNDDDDSSSSLGLLSSIIAQFSLGLTICSVPPVESNACISRRDIPFVSASVHVPFCLKPAYQPLPSSRSTVYTIRLDLPEGAFAFEYQTKTIDSENPET